MSAKELLAIVYMLSLQIDDEVNTQRENQEIIDNCINIEKEEVLPDYFIKSLKELFNHKFDFKSEITRCSDFDENTVDELSKALSYLSTFTLFTLNNGRVVVT